MDDPNRRLTTLWTESEEKSREGLIDEGIQLLMQAATVCTSVAQRARIYAECARLYEQKASEAVDSRSHVEAIHAAIGMLKKERQLHKLCENHGDEAKALFWMGELAESLPLGFDDAIGYYKLAAELAETVGDKILQCHSLRELGNSWRREAKHLKQQTLNLGDRAANNEHKDIATAHYKEAIEHLQNAAKLAKEELLDEDIGLITGDLADCYSQIQDFDMARQLFGERLKIAERLKDQAAMRRTYDSLGNIHLATGELRSAIQCYRIALAIAAELRDSAAKGRHYMSLGSACAMENDHSQAIEYYFFSIEENRFCGNLVGECKAYKEIAHLLSSDQAYPRAGYCYAVYRRLSRLLGDMEGRSLAHEKLHELMEQNLLEVLEGELVLDSKVDPDPYLIKLSASLQSLEATDSTMYEVPPSVATHSVNQSMSSFGRQSMIMQAPREDDFFDMIGRLSSRIDDQRAEMPMPSSISSSTSSLSMTAESKKRSKESKDSKLMKRVKSVIMPSKLTNTYHVHKSSLLSLKSSKSLKSLGMKSRASKSSLKSETKLNMNSINATPQSSTSNKPDDVFRSPKLPMRDLTNRRMSGQGTSKDPSLEESEHRLSLSSLHSFTSLEPISEGPVAPPRKTKVMIPDSPAPRADTDETEDGENIENIENERSIEGESKKRRFSVFPRMSITGFGLGFGRKKSKDEELNPQSSN